jgi:hypothetical protein
MPLPTAMDIHKITNELLMLASKVEEMRTHVSTSNSEVAIAYRTIYNDYEFKLRKRINDFWLYTTGSKDTLD